MNEFISQHSTTYITHSANELKTGSRERSDQPQTGQVSPLCTPTRAKAKGLCLGTGTTLIQGRNFPTDIGQCCKEAEGAGETLAWRCSHTGHPDPLMPNTACTEQNKAHTKQLPEIDQTNNKNMLPASTELTKKAWSFTLVSVYISEEMNMSQEKNGGQPEIRKSTATIKFYAEKRKREQKEGEKTGGQKSKGDNRTFISLVFITLTRGLSTGPDSSTREDCTHNPHNRHSIVFVEKSQWFIEFFPYWERDATQNWK
ncbi:hypothetical protein BaRGS_00010916 [Batillaria attramentaria]|uniref:Uncharacterized protein n=1 Tax=Batillaria attramentaria TaxID=370345 RepID=A0ABD0LEQ1_9CAEN